MLPQIWHFQCLDSTTKTHLKNKCGSQVAVTPDLRSWWELFSAESGSSTACTKLDGQLTQHLLCCLCAHSTMSLSPVTEYSLRAWTPLTTIRKSSRPRPWNCCRHPWSWSALPFTSHKWNLNHDKNHYSSSQDCFIFLPYLPCQQNTLLMLLYQSVNYTGNVKG